MGAHQQVDRIARRQLGYLLEENNQAFPRIGEILKFEGKNGPDGIKIKSPARNEPWHFFNPLESGSEHFSLIIESHHKALVENLRSGNRERAAFESAWLAHAVVDGLTPAHHYPYEEAVETLRAGKGKETRTTIKEKLVFKGDTVTQTITNTYKVYGPKGLYTSHHLFEFGVMLLLRPLRLADAKPKPADIHELKTKGYQKYFLHQAREVAIQDLYDEYLKNGWTTKLSNRVRHQLAPVLVKTVTMLWYSAAQEAGLCE